jgi:hypothetical protein
MEVNGYLHAQAALSIEEHPSALGKSIKTVILLLKYAKLLSTVAQFMNCRTVIPSAFQNTEC